MKTYMIKPLGWKDFAPKHQLQSSNAIALPLAERYYVFENNFGGWRWQFGIGGTHLAKTRNEAKTAAETHYIQQMEKGLEATP